MHPNENQDINFHLGNKNQRCASILPASEDENKPAMNLCWPDKLNQSAHTACSAKATDGRSHVQIAGCRPLRFERGPQPAVSSYSIFCIMIPERTAIPTSSAVIPIFSFRFRFIRNRTTSPRPAAEQSPATAEPKLMIPSM